MKKYILSFLIALIAGVTNQAWGQLKPPPPINPNIADSWNIFQPIPDIDTALHSAVSFRIGAKIYVVTGDTTSWFFRGRLIPTTYEYSLATKTWTKKAPFPGKLRIGAVGFSIGTKGYIGGGRNFGKPDSVGTSIFRLGNYTVVNSAPKTWERTDTNYTYTNARGDSLLNDFWEYDPIADKWTQKADIPGTKMGRAYGVGFAMDGKGYVGLGYDNGKIEKSLNSITETLIGPYVDSIKHTEIAPGPPPVYKIDTVFVQSKLREIDTIFTDSLDYLQDFWQYDPGSNTWTQKANFPGQGRAFASSMVLTDKALVGLGLGDSVPSTLYDDFYAYDPSTNLWVRTPDFPASKRSGAASFSNEFLGYIVGGNDGLPRKDFYEYNDISKTWDRLPDLPDSARSLAVYGSVGDLGFVGAGAGLLESYDNFFTWPMDPRRVTITNIPSGPFCGGEQITIDYKTTDGVTFNNTNQFTIEVSDSTGSFFYPVQASVISDTNSKGSLTFTIPISTLEGSNYKFRVTASSPDIRGTPTLTSFKINQVPSIISGPFADTTCLQAPALIRVNAAGTNLQYQWKKGGAPLSNGANINGVNTDSLFINAASLADAGDYEVEVTGTCSPKATSTKVSLVVTNIPPPNITNQPTSDTVCENSTKAFSLNANGTSLNYRWLKGNDTIRNSTRVTGSNTPSLTFTPASLIDSGWYRCIIFENCGSRTLSDSVKLNFYRDTRILEQPVNIDTVEFVNTGFKVITEGKNLKYQWYRGNTLLSNGSKYDGVDTDSLTIKNLQMSDIGFYRVKVWGDCGDTARSLLGLLEIDPMPVITQQPDSSADCETSTAYFSVKVDGANISYEWFKDGVKLVNGANISGADTRTIVISNISLADEGYYKCLVSTGPYTKVTSDSAKLRVKPIPAKPVVNPFGASGLQSSVSGDFYRWYIDNVFEPSLTQQTILGLTRVGDYRVRVTLEGCISELSDPYFWFPNATGIADVNSGNIKLYPNPATTMVDVEIPNGVSNGTVKVFDMVGKQISTTPFNNATMFSLNISGLDHGMYYVTVTAGDGSIYVGKLIKE